MGCQQWQPFVFANSTRKPVLRRFECQMILYRLHHENALQTLVDGSPLMLMAHLKPEYPIRPMQDRGERLFKVRRESYQVSQKNAADRLLHAFPAMIAAR